MTKENTKKLEFLETKNKAKETEDMAEKQSISISSRRLFLAIPPSNELRKEGRFLLIFSLVVWILASGVKIKEISILNIKADVNEPLIFFTLLVVISFLILTFTLKVFEEFAEWRLKYKETDKIQTSIIFYSMLKILLDLLAPYYLSIKSMIAIYHVVTDFAL